MKNFQSTQNYGVPAADLAAIETLYRAFNEGDTDLLDQVLTPDWEDIPRAPHQAAGREGIKPLIHEFRAAFPDIRIAVHEIIGAPGRAAVRAEIKGTHKGEWFGVAPTGKSFCIAIHEFHYLTEGRITRTWHLEDWFGWLAQVGASQAS
jgi:steroid delta-isomerase-like uncharacterized protein